MDSIRYALAIKVSLVLALLFLCSSSPAGALTAKWEERWDKTLAEAKKEGLVTIYVTAMWGPELRSMLTSAFKAKYGIKLEFTPLSGSGFVAKVQAEQNAGQYWVDVFGQGSGSFFTLFKPGNLLAPMEPLFILPEVMDPKVWDGGVIFNFDKKDKLWVEMLRTAARTIVYNTNLVKENEINSYKDLLKPQFKGKIAILDPIRESTGSAIPEQFVYVYGWEKGLEFFKDLLTKQEAAIFLDARLQVETVARGKYSVVLGGSGQYKADFIKLGAPLAVKIPKEGDYGTGSFGGLAIPKKLPHPNAATIFVNWLLTKEGQSLYAKGSGNPSRRLDASTEGVDPIFIPVPGEKMRWQAQESYSERPKLLQALEKIMRDIEK